MDPDTITSPETLPARSATHGDSIRPRFRRTSTGLAVAGLVFIAVAMIFRLQPVTTIPRLIITVGATFVPLIAAVVVLLAIASRYKLLLAVSLVSLVATTAVQASWYYIGSAPEIGRSTELRVLSSNIRLGRANAPSFVGLAEANADVITLAEITPEAVERFKAAGIEQHFPYSLLLAAPGAGGLGIWSRYPVAKVTAPRHPGVIWPAVRLKVPGVELDPLVASVHIMSPVAGDENTIWEWGVGMAGAKAQLDSFARIAGRASLIIGGDYNSTPDMRQFRDLLTNGYRDAVDQTGSGYAPTFKADSWLPPLITIDHILTRNAAVSSIHTVRITGSDHRALLATVTVPLESDQ